MLTTTGCTKSRQKHVWGLLSPVFSKQRERGWVFSVSRKGGLVAAGEGRVVWRGVWV
jgi:hypothetical protein